MIRDSVVARLSIHEGLNANLIKQSILKKKQHKLKQNFD